MLKKELPRLQSNLTPYTQLLLRSQTIHEDKHTLNLSFQVVGPDDLLSAVIFYARNLTRNQH